MIHLDTNHLIGLLVRDSQSAIAVDQWLAAGESLAASAVAWSEFLNGPVTPDEIRRVEVVLESRIISFGKTEGILAAELFNATGRRRGSRFDCLIAATAICDQATLATANLADFRAYTTFGLRLV